MNVKLIIKVELMKSPAFYEQRLSGNEGVIIPSSLWFN